MARAKQDEQVAVRCVVANVHTSAGKLVKEQRAHLPKDEAEYLIGQESVVDASGDPEPTEQDGQPATLEV